MAHGWGFQPFALEASGAQGPAARKFLRRLTRHLAMRSGTVVQDVAVRVTKQVAVALTKGKAEALVAARPPPPPAP